MSKYSRHQFLPRYIRCGLLFPFCRYGIVYEGSHAVFYIADPALAQQIQTTEFEYFYDQAFFPNEVVDMPGNNFGLINTKGEKWKHFRQSVSPAFRVKNARLMSAQLGRCAQRLVDKIKVKYKKSKGKFNHQLSLS